MGDPVPAELLEVVQRQRLAFTELHPGADLFTEALIGDPDHLGVGDGGVGEEELLDLTWVDVFTAADDHVLDPT